MAKHYNKLVRDLIPEIIRKNGAEPFIRIAEEQEYVHLLEAKLHEEVTEFLERPCVEEFADIVEVLRGICVAKGIDMSQVEEVRMKKYQERGGFERRIVLEKVVESVETLEQVS